MAYADCTMDWKVGERLRNLDFHAKDFVSRDEAYEIMKQAVPDGYNDFDAEIILQWPESVQVQCAREASVCLYLKGKELPKPFTSREDEYDVDEYRGILRMWWD